VGRVGDSSSAGSSDYPRPNITATPPTPHWRSCLPVHPAADIFDPLAGDDLAALVADIKAHGIREPIGVMKDGTGGWQVVDGRNRLTAAEMARVDLFTQDGKPIWRYFKTVGGDSAFDPVAYVISSNLMRRHLDESQRAMAAGRLANLKRGDNQHTAIAASSTVGVTQAKAAALLSVSVDSVQRAVTVQREGSPELVKQVERGEVSVSAAARSLKPPSSKERQLRALREKRETGTTPPPSLKRDTTIGQVCAWLRADLKGASGADHPRRAGPHRQPADGPKGHCR
jgi:DNA-binding transcriptional regulator YdaS (Cro superfamily)